MKKASEVLLHLKEIFNKEEIPFYAIDFVLEKPRKDNGTPNESMEEIRVNDFLYSDNYEAGLEERLTKAVEEARYNKINTTI